MPDPQTWQIRSPGDLSVTLPEVTTSDVNAAVLRSVEAFEDWRRTSLDDRIAHLRSAQAAIRDAAESLATSITEETGKPITEARGELGAVIAKFDLTINDAERWIRERPVSDGTHPALIRYLPRGPAAVIAPFNFPIHLGHGATVAYLLAGNPVLYKPSPLAAVTGSRYLAAMQSALPDGVIELVQGWGEAGHALCVDPRVRSLCFTGSIPVGRSIAAAVAGDYSKSVALELGGKNAILVLDDADLDTAAESVTSSLCATAGQRCNAVSRVLVHHRVREAFLDRLTAALKPFIPADPREESCRLGPVISDAAVARYRNLLLNESGNWILPGSVPESVGGLRGHYVTPAVLDVRNRGQFLATPLHSDEAFCPILSVLEFRDDADAVALHNTSPFGLTASVFTESPERFDAIGCALHVGNLYRNLPSTFSPSTLPFGGLGISGNGKPGGRGFIRFAADEQAVQWKA